MIRSFKDKVTEAVFHGRRPKGFPADLFAVTRRKLLLIDFVANLEDLRRPPANRLEA
jgi:proteic killer suppression protein